MYIGIDVGTSSVKLTVIDMDGQIIFENKKEYPLYISGLNAEQNPDDWFDATVLVLKSVPSNIKNKVLKMGFSGQMHSLVVLDLNDEIIRPAILWNDQRTYEEVDDILNYFGAEKIIKLTSNMPVTGFTAPKLLWLKKNEKNNFDKINKILLPKDYIVYKLTKIHATDYSDASGTLLLDVENKKWSNEITTFIGIKPNVLPKLYDSTDIVGTLLPNLAEDLGYNEGVKIIIGGSDQAVGALGSFVIDNNEISIAMGTSGVIFLNLDKYYMDQSKSLHVFANVVGGYHFMGVMLTCAQTLKWWQNITESSSIDTLISKINNFENEIIFLPYLQGERTPINNPFAKGMFYGLTLDHKQADMTLSILEGVVFAFKDILNAIKKSNIKIKKAYVSGGGTQSSVWMQMMADVLNIDIIVSETNDTVSYGAALLALINDCGLEKVHGLKKTRKTGYIFNPQKDKFKYYSSKFKQYKLLYKHNKMSHK